jgi:hypothetical protein
MRISDLPAPGTRQACRGAFFSSKFHGKPMSQQILIESRGPPLQITAAAITSIDAKRDVEARAAYNSAP